MTQFCALFLGIYSFLAPQRGGHGTMPPSKYAPDSNITLMFLLNCILQRKSYLS